MFKIYRSNYSAIDHLRYYGTRKVSSQVTLLFNYSFVQLFNIYFNRCGPPAEERNINTPNVGLTQLVGLNKVKNANKLRYSN